MSGPDPRAPNAHDLPAPDSTAVRVALWRALHLEIDPPPHILEDRIGLQLAAPGEDWRRRPDMDPDFTKPFRASILARARFIEDLVLEQVARGVSQYVILGAGLVTAERLSSAFSRRRRSQPWDVRSASNKSGMSRRGI
jgi:O-methyltransferase involved in polyketide biosynthesis